MWRNKVGKMRDKRSLNSAKYHGCKAVGIYRI